MASPAKVHRLYHKLQIAAHCLQKDADRRLAAVGLTTSHVAVLHAAAIEQRCTQRTIARALHVNESAIAALVPKLIESGLLKRSRSKLDPRSYELALTAAGEQQRREAGGLFSLVNGKIDRLATPEEIAAMASFLERMTDAFERAE